MLTDRVWAPESADDASRDRLVGRDAELAELIRGLNLRDGASYVLAGAAGLGKSSLVRHIVHELPAGREIRHVIATSAVQGVPFGAFAPIMPDVDADASVPTVLQKASAAMTQRPDQQRMLLVVDDAHMLDDCSATLLLHLVRNRVCTALITMRTPTPVPEPVTALWKDGHAARLDLEPLTLPELGAMARRLLGGPLAAPTVRWLSDVTGGNPMYAVELIRAARHSGALHQIDGQWMVGGPMVATPRLVDLIESRLTGASQGAIEVLDLLAIGEPLTLDVLEDLVGADAVADAEREGLIAMRPGTRPVLAGPGHPLFGEVRRQQMRSTRLRELSRTLLRAFPRSTPPTGDELVRLARWQLAAGGEEDLELMTAAAGYARRMYDLDLAATLAQAAVEAGAGPSAAVTLAEALNQLGRNEDATAVLERATDRATLPDDIATIAATWAHIVGTRLGDRARAESILAAASARVNDRNAALKLLDAYSTFPFYSGEPRPLLASATELIETDDHVLASRAAMDAGMAYGFLGELSNAQAMAERGLAIRDAGGIGAKRQNLQYIGTVLGLRAAGRLAEAEALARGVIDPSTDEVRDVVASFEHLLAMVLIEQGHIAEAEQHLRSAAATSREADDTGPVRWCLGGLALTRSLRGDTEGARHALAEMDAGHGAWMTMYDLDLAERGRAWMHAQDGRVDEALELLRSAAAAARAKDCRVAEAFLLHDMVRLGAPDEVVERLRSLAGLVEGPLVGCFALHAEGAATKRVRLLEDAANQFEAFGAALLAAEAGAEVARMHRSAANSRIATGWERHVAELVHACDSVRTPALEHAGLGAQLTPREREIVRLAASGMSSKAIADALVLSVRTVENHLHRAYDKLGVHGRDELSTLT